jgi:hypothetical protein
MKYKYEYTKLKKGERQYDDYDLTETRVVDARYVHSVLHEGNPFIEALPAMYSVEESMRYYSKTIHMPSAEEIRNMNTYEINESLGSLNDFRVPLPFYTEVEEDFRSALIGSYQRRQLQADENTDLELVVDGNEVVSHSKLQARSVSDPATGFVLLGSSGCGKSTGINMMLQHYPQVIMHRMSTWMRFPQIVWLHVNFQPNDNMQAFFTSIGGEIDRALGNIQPVYEQEIRSKRTLGSMEAKVRELIERFSIGILIIDEIELLVKVRKKESSLELLMTLCNETGVAIAVVGTEDAYDKLFGDKRRITRRLGPYIRADDYCQQEGFFKFLLQNLCAYSWTGEKIKLTSDLTNAFYDTTEGNISELIDLYKLVQREALRQNPYAEITPEFVLKVADRWYRQRSEAHKWEGPVLRKAQIKRDEQKKVNSMAENQRQRELQEEFLAVLKSQPTKAYNQLLAKTVDALNKLLPQAKRSDIENAFNIYMKDREPDEVSQDDTIIGTQAAYYKSQERIKGKKQKNKKKTKTQERAERAQKYQKELMENDQNEVKEA